MMLETIKQDLRIDGTHDDARLMRLIALAQGLVDGALSEPEKVQEDIRYIMAVSLIVQHYYDNEGDSLMMIDTVLPFVNQLRGV